MNKYKNFKDERLTEDWLRDIKLDVTYFNTTHIKLLQAQRLANSLLSSNSTLLTTTQIKELQAFIKKMNNKKTRIKLNQSQAYPILNLGTKINRQIFRSKKLDF